MYRQYSLKNICTWVLISQALLLSACDSGSDSNPEPVIYNTGPSSIAFEDASILLADHSSVGGYGPIWADINADQLLDLIIMNHGAIPSLLIQQPGPFFINVAKESGIQFKGFSYSQQNDRHGASCGDFDNDGDIDLYISHGAKRGETLGIKYDELLSNIGGSNFVDITQQSGVLNGYGRARSGRWVDYNADGLLDLYTLNFDSPNVMYENTGSSHFIDVTQSTNLAAPGYKAIWTDYDQDGYVDVLLGFPLRLLRNAGNGTFELADSGLETHSIFGNNFAVGDIDNDGDIDLFVTSKQSESILFINDNKQFQPLDTSHRWGFIQDSTTRGTSLGDLDNDGDLDIVVVGSYGVRVFENRGDLIFSGRVLDMKSTLDVAEENGTTALGDFDNDGYLDIAVDGRQQHILLRNTAEGNNWLKILFRGSVNNRMGIGNKVWIKASDGEQLPGVYREYFGDSSAQKSAGCAPLHIGLGNINHVDIKVAWPNGNITLLSDIPANQMLLIEEYSP